MIMNERIKIKKLNIPVYFIMLYLIVIMLSIKTGYARYLSFFFAFIFIVSSLVTINEIKVKKKYVSLFVFFCLYVTLGLINGDTTQIIKNVSMLVLNLTPFFIFDYLNILKNKKKLFTYSKILKDIMHMLLIYTISITTYYLFKNPYIARYMANFDPSNGIDTSMGINVDLPTAIGGGYVLVYGVILLPPLYIFLHKNKNIYYKQKVKYILLSLMILLFIVKAGFATAFLISIGSTIVTLVLSSKKKLINKFFIVSLLVLFLFIISSPTLLKIIIDMISNLLPEKSIISVRLNEILPTIYGNAKDVTSFSMRIEGLTKSISTLAENPILGISYKVGFDYSLTANYVSFHTEWVDILAQYGLIFGGFLLFYIGSSLKDLAEMFHYSDMENVIKIIISTVIVLGFFNPIFTSSIYVILMIYVPCYLLDYSNKCNVRQL